MGAVAAPRNINGTSAFGASILEVLDSASVVFAQQVWIFYPYRRFEVRGALRYEAL
jgi:hypothetical protein